MCAQPRPPVLGIGPHRLFTIVILTILIIIKNNQQHIMGENWDNDFDVEDLVDLRASMMSNLSRQSSQGPVQAQAQADRMIKPSRQINLAAYAEDEDEDFKDGLGTLNAGSAAAQSKRLRHKSSMQLVKDLQRRGDDFPSHIKEQQRQGLLPTGFELDELDELDGFEDDSVQTLRKKPSTFGHNSSLISGTLYEPPQSKEILRSPLKVKGRSFKMDDEADLEDGFDFDDDMQPGRLTQSALQNLRKIHMDDSDIYNQLESRTFSRQTAASISSAHTTSTESSDRLSSCETDDAEDFETGFADIPVTSSLQQILKETKRKILAQSKEDDYQLSRKYGKHLTLPQRKSNNLSRNDLDDTADLIEGLEIDDNFDLNGEHLHVNAVVEGNKKSSRGKVARPARKMPSMALPKSHNISGLSTITKSSLRDQAVESARIPSQGESRVRPLRPAQSMVNLGHKTINHSRSMANIGTSKSQSRGMADDRDIHTRRLRPAVLGDGSELDSFEDLPETTQTQTIRGLPDKKLEMYKEKPVKNTIRRTKGKKSQRYVHESLSPSRNRYKHTAKPALIKQLGIPAEASIKSDSGDMRYNFEKQIWEGNDLELKKFDSLSKQPGLIAYISNKGIQIINDMWFDPQNLRWVKINEKKEPQEEEDPFAGVQDLPEEDPMTKSHTSSRSSSGFQKMKSSRSTPNIGQLGMGDEFFISKDFASRLAREDERWNRKYGAWFPPDENTNNREPLDEIRDMVMS